MTHRLLALAALALLAAPALAPAQAPAPAPTVIIAEGERFTPADAKGWKVTHQDDSYGSHTYGGMWMTHGGCLGAPPESDGSVATQAVTVPKAGKYRVWSKYQAPPYFNYLHKVEVVQKGKVLHSAVYGKAGTPRLWSFSGVSDELWWVWGVDHDAAEAPRTLIDLEAGPAEVRLVTVAGPAPAGDRFIDFIVLTTNPDDTYTGFKPYQVGSPFTLEALAQSKLYFRFRNAGKAPAQVTASRGGHFQPNYGGAAEKFPAAPVPPGQWSEWVNIGPFCRLVHDEGVTFALADGLEIPLQFARDPAGKDLAGEFTLRSGEAAHIPIDVTWRKGSAVSAARARAEGLILESKTWRRANNGKKPERIPFYGSFSGTEEWVGRLKDALGYNTLLPDRFAQIKRATVAQHHGSPAQIRALADSLKGDARERLRVVSFGDEIGLGKIDFADKAMNEKFRAWLAAKGVTAAELKLPLEKAQLTEKGDARLVWYSNLFNEEERFGSFREMTDLAKSLFGPETLTGANYSPHHLALYYGPVYQWVDIFKHRGMAMAWAEDYVFSVPEVPQILSFSLGQLRCGVKYNKQPIHYYVMPHAPGQVPGFLRRNLLLAVGSGAAHIDNFWVGPPERFTENYVAWGATDTYRTLSEGIFDAAEAEKLQAGGAVRKARVAVITGKATDFHESRLMVAKAKDPFLARCQNAPAEVNQTLCRKEQQYLYLALRRAQHAVDILTEDDLAEGALKDYDVAYFAGEWVDGRAVKALEPWVRAGGVLVATGGLGHRNQYDEADPALLRLLGLKGVTTAKSLIAPRTLLELPLAAPIDTITLGDDKVPAYGMKQVLTPDGAKVLGTWAGGGEGARAAVTAHPLGKGQCFAVGTLAGAAWLRTGLRAVPYARGGRKMVYNPEGYTPGATKLVRLGVDARKPALQVECGQEGVEAVVIDHKDGSLLTLVNWTNAPLKGLPVAVRLPFVPREVRSVTGQKTLAVKSEAGVTRFTLDLAEGDFVLLKR